MHVDLRDVQGRGSYLGEVTTMTPSAPPSSPAPAPPTAPSGPRFGSPRQRLRSFGRPPRIIGLDVARALAVIGMVGAHVGRADEPWAWSDPGTWSDIVNGRSAILFAVLAGISVAMVTGRTRRPEPAELPALRLRLVGRGAAIFAIGVLLELLGTGVAVILTVYGILYVAALPFLRWRLRNLWIATAALALAGPPLLALVMTLSPDLYGPGVSLVIGIYPLSVWITFLLAGLAIGRTDLAAVRTAVVLLVAGAVVSAIGYGVAAGFSEQAESWEGDLWGEDLSSWSESGSAIEGSDSAGGSDLGSSVEGPGSAEGSAGEDSGGSAGADEYGYETLPPEDVDFEGLLCDADTDGWVVCYPADDASGIPGESGFVDDSADSEDSYLETVEAQKPWTQMRLTLITDAPHSGGVAEILGSGGLAVAIIGLCLLITRGLRWLWLPLASLGSMPLTAYAAHVVAILVVSGPLGEGIADNLQWLWFTLGLLAGCTVWAVLLGRGPLERLVGRSADFAAKGT